MLPSAIHRLAKNRMGSGQFGQRTKSNHHHGHEGNAVIKHRRWYLAPKNQKCFFNETGLFILPFITNITEFRKKRVRVNHMTDRMRPQQNHRIYHYWVTDKKVISDLNTWCMCYFPIQDELQEGVRTNQSLESVIFRLMLPHCTWEGFPVDRRFGLGLRPTLKNDNRCTVEGSKSHVQTWRPSLRILTEGRDR